MGLQELEERWRQLKHELIDVWEQTGVKREVLDGRFRQGELASQRRQEQLLGYWERPHLSSEDKRRSHRGRCQLSTQMREE
mmetsp:Transcript_84584/g.272638  ORF Transcript_84584/g.272638 Transcript_84584/m.272638 type:complete len:81 (+) Transcript_84584:649-891(+)